MRRSERAIEMLELVELPDPEKAFKSYPHQLSGGQRQRAMIAQSLSCDPKLLIADEPTTALDVTVQAEILDLMRNLRNKLDSAIVLITHDMGVVADLADRIAVMRKGRIVETGTAEADLPQPAARIHPGAAGRRAAPGTGCRRRRGRRRHRGPGCRSACGTGRRGRRRSWIRREAENRTALAQLRAEKRQVPGRAGAGTDRRRHRVPQAGPRAGLPGGRGRQPVDLPRPGGRAWWGSPAPARPPSAGPPSASCRSPPAPCTSWARTSPAQAERQGPARAAAERRHGLPGPVVVAEPAAAHRREHRRADVPGQGGQGRRTAEADRGPAGPGGAAARLPQPLPARALRRPEAARRHRPRAVAEAASCWSPTSRRRALDVSVQATVLELLPEPAAGAEASPACSSPTTWPWSTCSRTGSA